MHDTLSPCHATTLEPAAGLRPGAARLHRRAPRVALVGNPNAGKTTLFNRLTGLRAKTANFPGTTLERRLGRLALPGVVVELEDLPGLYTLAAGNVEERVARDAIQGSVSREGATAVILVLDATNLARNLFLAGEVRDLGVPVLVVLNMIDLAEKERLEVDAAALSRELEAPVVALSARTGAGMDRLREELEAMLGERVAPLPLVERACPGCRGCESAARFDWAEDLAGRVSRGAASISSERTQQIDRVLTHPVAGLGVFAAAMSLVFIAIFTLARYPMGLIESWTADVGAFVAGHLPGGDLRSLLVDGLIGGVGGVLVFLPQICILFFFISLLEDSGYLARAAFVMDRLMGKVGLPGKAFVPMLSAHACAIPAIMSTRVIEDRRDRLATILVLPLMTCSARLPVYALVTAVLFADRPVLGGLSFAAAYALGIGVALGTAWLFRRTIVPGDSLPLLLELPTYKVPSLRNALLAMRDRAGLFLTKAGSVILLIAIGMWVAATYPRLGDASLRRLASSADLAALDTAAKESADAARAGDSARARAIEGRAAALRGRYALQHSLAGRLGKLIEPAFRPLGFDWRMDVGVLTSFAARETFVSTLAVVYGVGAGDEGGANLHQTLRAERRSDGSPLFGLATALPLLVFYVLAMQCLATQAVTRRETGSWKWALFQLGYMTVLAYSAALVTRIVLRSVGIA